MFALFDTMKPVETAFMKGEWDGGAFETGHQTCKWVVDTKFAGKRFNSDRDVEPVFVWSAGGQKEFYKPNGYAQASKGPQSRLATHCVEVQADSSKVGQLREVRYRGKVTATLVYDSLPIMDYFLKVDENTVIAAADNKNKPEGTFFFWLRRAE